MPNYRQRCPAINPNHIPDYIIRRLPDTMFDLNCYIGKINRAYPEEGSISYVAIDKDQIIGVQLIGRFRHIVYCRGTVVRPYRQRLHIANKLWVTMIKQEKPKKIVVETVSNRGFSLVELMREEYPDIRWEIEKEPYIRSLRKSRKLHRKKKHS